MQSEEEIGEEDEEIVEDSEPLNRNTHKPRVVTAHDRVTGVTDRADKRFGLFFLEMNIERDGKSRERAEDDKHERQCCHPAIIPRRGLVLEIRSLKGGTKSICSNQESKESRQPMKVYRLTINQIDLSHNLVQVHIHRKALILKEIPH